MIALFINWTGRAIEQSLAQRVASSLAVGHPAGGKFFIGVKNIIGSISWVIHRFIG